MRTFFIKVLVTVRYFANASETATQLRKRDVKVHVMRSCVISNRQQMPFGWPNQGAGHVAQPRERKHAHALLRGSPRERDRLENTGVHWEIVLKWTLKE